MTEKTIAHTDLDRLVDRLGKTAVVFVPAEDEAGDVALTEASRAERVVLDYRNFRLSPKAFFLPQNQTLLRFRGSEATEPSPPEKETILFGARGPVASAPRWAAGPATATARTCWPSGSKRTSC